MAMVWRMRRRRRGHGLENEETSMWSWRGSGLENEETSTRPWTGESGDVDVTWSLRCYGNLSQVTSEVLIWTGFIENHHQGVFGKSPGHPQTCYGHGSETVRFRTSNSSIQSKIRPFHQGDCFELLRISWFPIYKPREGSALWKF